MASWARLALGFSCACMVVLTHTPVCTAEAQSSSGLTSLVASVQDGSIKSSTLVHPQRSVKWGRSVGIVDAPLAEVQQVVEDYARYQTFMPHFKVSKVLSQRGSSALVYMQASIAKNTMTLWAQMKVGPKPNEGETRIIEGKMVDGNMDAMFARWELTPIDGQRTLVAFQLLMDPKLPLPDSLVNSENESASRKTIRALRQVLAERSKKLAVQR